MCGLGGLYVRSIEMNETLAKKSKRLKLMLLAGLLLIGIGGTVAYRMQQNAQFMARLENSTGGFEKADVPRLIRVLEDNSMGEMQARAARALGKIGPDAVDAMPALVEKRDYFGVGNESVVHDAINAIQTPE
jgi:hypothetical protein